jgi:hypothetical protein
MLKPLLLALSTVAAFQQTPGVTVTGHVRSLSTGGPLRFARVEVIVDSRPTISASTDSSGAYVLPNVPLGHQRIRASHLDHAPLEVGVVLRGIVTPPVDFELELRPVSIPLVSIRGGRSRLSDTIAATDAELSQAITKAMETSPGVAELGLAEAAHDVPGQDQVDPTDVLWVRGGTADLKLVLLNGAPVYAPFHIGGLIHALDADVLRSATLYLGGAPSKYDGGLSYVMDMETRSGRTTRTHARIAADMLSAQARMEGPVGRRVAYLFTGRDVHGLGTGPFFNGDFPYGYGDALGRVDLAVGQNSGLTVMGFYNRERIQIDSTTGESDASWGNHAGSLRYVGYLNGTNFLVTVGGGHFETELPLGGLRPLLTIGTSDRKRFALDVDRSMGTLHLYAGASHDDLMFGYQALSQFAGGVAGMDSVLVRARGRGSVTGAYAEATTTAIKRVRLRGGLRADKFSRLHGVRVAPRVSATLLLTDHAAMTLAAGQYRQYVRAPHQSTIFLGSPIPDTTSSSALSVAKAAHFTMGLTQELAEGTRLGLEGYYKEFSDIPSDDGDRANASGVDLWVRRSTGSYQGWIGYSLAWVWSVDQRRNSTGRDFAGRQMVNIGVDGPLTGSGHFDLRVGYGAGLPFTAVPEPEAGPPVFDVIAGAGASAALIGPVPNGAADAPSDAYLRVDAQIERRYTRTFHGNSYTFMPYLRVLNALNRRDALFYRFDRGSNSAEPLGDLPILPVIGFEWKF